MDRALVQTGHTSRAPGVRTHPDRCPTAIDLHQAADGFLARLRLTGGRCSPAAAHGLAALAAPGATIELTARANLQLRSLDADAGAGLAAALAGLGVLPSLTHERARTIVARPTIGRMNAAGPSGAAHDALVSELDLAVQRVPGAAGLSGRVMTLVADLQGHPLAEDADLLVTTDANGRATLQLGQSRIGAWPLADAAEPAAATLGLLAVACRAASVWRRRELTPKAQAELVARARTLTGASDPAGAAPAFQSAGQAPGDAGLGPAAQADGRFAIRAQTVLGRLSGEQLAALAALADAHGSDLRIDVDRTITLVDLASAEAAEHAARAIVAAGLDVDASSPWSGISACAGTGCRSTLADVRAAATLRASGRKPTGRPEHFAGCGRRCGAPHAAQTIVALAGDTPTMLAQRAAALPQEATP